MTKIINTDNLKEFRKRLDERYAFTDGAYEEMSVGVADQLNSTRFSEDKTAYNFRTAGGPMDIGNRAFNTIVGGSLVPRNIVRNTASYSGSGITLNLSGGVWTFSGKATSNISIGLQESGVKIPNGHYYGIFCTDWTGANLTGSPAITWRVLRNNAWEAASNKIALATADSTFTFSAISGYDFGTGFTFKMVIIDLSLMFGSVFMTDFVSKVPINLRTNWFLKTFPNIFDIASAGNNAAIYSVNTSKYVTIGFNQFNPTTGTAKLIGGQTYQITGSYTSLSFTDIIGVTSTITPDSNGEFTVSSNGELTVTGGNDTDTCVHLVWSGYRNGDFEPYTKKEYALDSSLTLRGIPKLDEAGELYFDGDEYSSSGTVTRKYGTRNYIEGDYDDSTVLTNGTTTVYPLAEPTTETAQTFSGFQVVDDFGTEEFVDKAYANGTRKFQMPVGHKTKYSQNLRDKLQNLPSIPEETGDYIVHYDKPTRKCSFVAKTSELPVQPSTDGTYKLVCTVANGEASYTWEAEE